MKNVLVTGGAGFIGSHLCEGLLARGYKVRVLDSLVYGQREWVPAGCEFIEGDIRDLDTCRRAAAGMDGVFHCAAMSRSGPSQEQIDVCTGANITGTQNMLLAARDAGVKRFIYSGSSTYYGNRPPPHRESDPPDLLNIYGLTKRVGEQYCLLFDEGFDLPCVVLRYFNVYGPRQPETGAYALVLGIFLRRHAEGKRWRFTATAASGATSSMCATWWRPISPLMKARCAAKCSMSAAAPAFRSRNWRT